MPGDTVKTSTCTPDKFDDCGWVGQPPPGRWAKNPDTGAFNPLAKGGPVMDGYSDDSINQGTWGRDPREAGSMPAAKFDVLQAQKEKLLAEAGYMNRKMAKGGPVKPKYTKGTGPVNIGDWTAPMKSRR